MGWEEVPRSLADRNPIDPDDPQAGRHNLMTAIQALSQQLPALRMMTLEKERRLPENARWAPGVGPDIKGQDRVYTLPDLVSDAAGFLPSSVDPIEVMAEVGPLDELLKAVTPFVARTMRGGEKAAPQGIRTYHGTTEPFSPEEGFPLGRFSNEKFRTGEGSMVRGAGHYMGEEVAVPRGYRDRAVKNDTEMMVGDDSLLKIYNDLEHEADVAWPRLPQTIEAQEQGYKAHDLAMEKRQVLEDLMVDGDLLGIEERAELGSYSDEALKWFNEEIAPKFSRKGALAEIDYQVSPSDLLDQDRTFAEQSPKVKEALIRMIKRAGISANSIDASVDLGDLTPGFGGYSQPYKSIMRWKPGNPEVENHLAYLKGQAEDANTKVTEAVSKGLSVKEEQALMEDRRYWEQQFSDFLDEAQKTSGEWDIRPDATGMDIQHAIEYGYQGQGFGKDAAAEAASMDMLQEGIRGLKFRDQGSRQPYSGKLYDETGAQVASGTFGSRQRAQEQYESHVKEYPEYRVELEEVPEEELTHNYVAFDPDDLMIQRWLALGGTGVGLHALTEEQRKAQSESQ